ncbi:MAG: hypothetical protein ACRDX8_02180 [Acidimicrobiales bacterium]
MSAFEDLARDLEEDPAKREALRALLLSEELLALPATVAALVAEVRELVAEVKELARAMREANSRLDRLESDVATLKSDVSTLKSDVKVLRIDVDVLKDDAAYLKGSDLERRWQRNLPSYLGTHFRRLAVFDPAQLWRLLEGAIDAGRIQPEEAREVGLADVVAQGRRADGIQVYLVVEVSAVVDRDDIDRALRRSVLLARATGAVAQAVGAGNRATQGAVAIAGREDVLLVLQQVEAA